MCDRGTVSFVIILMTWTHTAAPWGAGLALLDTSSLTWTRLQAGYLAPLLALNVQSRHAGLENRARAASPFKKQAMRLNELIISPERL